MKVAGIDLDSYRADVVLIPIDDAPVTWRRFTFGTKAMTALERCRRIRAEMPTASYWEAESVILIAVEEPQTHTQRTGSGTLYRAEGAIISTLPPSIDVWELPPWEWRRELGIAGGKREAAKASTRDYVLAHPLIKQHGIKTIETELAQDAMDAFCVALAARTMLNRASEAA